ncbi:MAG: DNA-processing protein DprA [Wenzhouxiangella sp.]
MTTTPPIEAWLALLIAPGIGGRRGHRLADFLGGPLAWTTASDKELREAGLTPAMIRHLRQPDPAAMACCQAWLKADNHHLITLEDPLYPPLLKAVEEPPLGLFVVGDPAHLVRPQVAIVGSRNASTGGLDHARDFAATLARAGFVITSGLADGVDGHAHAGCLDAGGQTLAVMGTGPDRVYPARHKPLAQRITRQGALITQFVPGTEPKPGHFPVRNRIISGMTLGTLVVEAGLRSGSLITARQAADQGREVFAIPGSVHNPLARGCHRLIRDGARLVETADEVVEALAPLAEELAGEIGKLLAQELPSALDKSPKTPHLLDDPDYQRLLDALGFDPTPVDQVIQRSQLTAAEVSSMLLMLELDGLVDTHPGGRYSRNR